MNMSVCCSEQQNTHELPCMYPWWKLGIFHEFTLFPCQHYTSCPWGHAVRAAGLQFRWARNDADVRLRPSTDICSQIAGKHWSESSSICRGQRWLAGKILWQKHSLWVATSPPPPTITTQWSSISWPCRPDVFFLRAPPRDLFKRNSSAFLFLQPAWSHVILSRMGAAQPRPPLPLSSHLISPLA